MLDFIGKLIHISIYLHFLPFRGTEMAQATKNNHPLCYIVNDMTADDLVTQRVRASAAILTSATVLYQWFQTILRYVCAVLTSEYSQAALQRNISMAQCNTAVTPLLTHWSYCSLALRHRYEAMKMGLIQTPTPGWQITNASIYLAFRGLH